MTTFDRIAAALAPLYIIESELGRGALGAVYSATAAEGGRAAVKVLSPDLVALMRDRDAFVATMQRAARVQHAGLLPLLGAGTTADGQLYYAMALAEGETARDRVERDGLLPPSEIVAIGAACGDALDAAHAAGIVHGTLAPANLHLSDAGVRIADLGVHAALVAAGIEPQRLATLMGAPQYMSPEQLAGGTMDARSDVYSLGASLYELLTGKPPFGGRTTSYVIASVLADEPSAPEGDEVTGHATATILRAIEKAPADRWSSAAAFARALRDEHRPGTPVGSAAVPGRADGRRGCLQVAALITAGLGAAAALFFAVLR